MQGLEKLSLHANKNVPQDEWKQLEGALELLLPDTSDKQELKNTMSELRALLDNPSACTPADIKGIETKFNKLFADARSVLEGHIQELEALLKGGPASLHGLLAKLEKAFAGLFVASAALTAIGGIMMAIVLAIPAIPLLAGVAFLGVTAGGLLVAAGGLGGYFYARHQKNDELSDATTSALQIRVGDLKDCVRVLKKETALMQQVGRPNALKLRRELEAHRKKAIVQLEKQGPVSLELELSNDILVRQDLEGVKDAFKKLRFTKDKHAVDPMIVGIVLDVVDAGAYRGDARGYAKALNRVYAEFYQARQIRYKIIAAA
jgi:hypothetical protein